MFKSDHPVLLAGMWRTASNVSGDTKRQENINKSEETPSCARRARRQHQAQGERGDTFMREESEETPSCDHLSGGNSDIFSTASIVPVLGFAARFPLGAGGWGETEERATSDEQSEETTSCVTRQTGGDDIVHEEAATKKERGESVFP